MQLPKKGLEPGVGHPSGLCARYKHLSPQGKEHLRVSASFSVAKSGRRGDRSPICREAQASLQGKVRLGAFTLPIFLVPLSLMQP